MKHVFCLLDMYKIYSVFVDVCTLGYGWIKSWDIIVPVVTWVV